jgi:hypothetical protein
LRSLRINDGRYNVRKSRTAEIVDRNQGRWIAFEDILQNPSGLAALTRDGIGPNDDQIAAVAVVGRSGPGTAKLRGYLWCSPFSVGARQAEHQRKRAGVDLD